MRCQPSKRHRHLAAGILAPTSVSAQSNPSAEQIVKS